MNMQVMKLCSVLLLWQGVSNSFMKILCISKDHKSAWERVKGPASCISCCFLDDFYFQLIVKFVFLAVQQLKEYDSKKLVSATKEVRKAPRHDLINFQLSPNLFVSFDVSFQ